jgi:DNA repair protein RadA/Sms
VILVAGEPGIGKSTLLLQILADLARQGRDTLYASGEESLAQVAARARRLGIAPERISFVPGRELPAVLDAAASARPAVVVVDSIQSIRDPAQTTLAGGPAQVRACADGLIGLAKREAITVLLAGQVTKVGDLAGPRTLEHAVDTVCSFDGDGASGLRMLSGGKNRFGAEGELAWFEMDGSGLREVAPPALASRGPGEAGAAIALVAAGRRALAVEVQGLVVSREPPPRRNVSGLDPRRFGMIAAVVDRALGLSLARGEVYGSTAGGLRVDDPGADLAVAAALASADCGVAPPPASAFAGEVTLTGAVRPPPNLASRLAAAAAAGVETVFCPVGDVAHAALRVIPVSRVGDALAWRRRSSGATGPRRAALATKGRA